MDESDIQTQRDELVEQRIVEALEREGEGVDIDKPTNKQKRPAMTGKPRAFKNK